MPVHLDTHEPDIDLTPGTTKSDVVAFLYGNPKYGYKPAEIRDLLDIPHGTATTTLKRLHEDGYIGKTQDSYYHALEARDDLHHYVGSLDQLDRMFNAAEENSSESSTSEGERTQADCNGDDEFEAELTAVEEELEN